MKATGIVRRIDDLGRVVIPKEIRRTLRIREGDPLEIFTDREGGVILKKYSPIDELSEVSKGYAESLEQTIGNIIIICDMDSIVSLSGASKKEYMDKKISDEIEGIIENRKLVRLNGNEIVDLYDDEEAKGKYTEQVICPIISGGDAIGAVVIASKEDVDFGDVETKLAETAASFLGKQMEE